jgi:hypothetical protein
MAELDLAFCTAKVLSVDTIAALLKLMSQAGGTQIQIRKMEAA